MDYFDEMQEERVETPRGTILVAVQGDRSKPAVLTFHDLGLNRKHCSVSPTCLFLFQAFSFYLDVSNFQAFFNFSEMRNLIQNFCIYHVNAPGQEEGAPTLPEG